MRICTICARPDRPEIDRRLGAGASIHDVAGEFGVASPNLAHHLCEMRVAGILPPEEPDEASFRAMDSLVAIIGGNRLGAPALRLLERRERALLARPKLRLARRAQEGPGQRLIESREWQELKKRLVLTLEQFPDAYEAVVRALGDD